MKALLLTVILLLATHAYGTDYPINLDLPAYSTCATTAGCDILNLIGQVLTNGDDVVFSASSASSFQLNIGQATNMNSLTMSPSSSATVVVNVQSGAVLTTKTLIINAGATINVVGSLIVTQVANVTGSATVHGYASFSGLTLSGSLNLIDSASATISGEVHIAGSIVSSSSITFYAATIYINASSTIKDAYFVLANFTYVWAQNGTVNVNSMAVTGTNNTISAAQGAALNVSTLNVAANGALYVVASLTVTGSADVNGTLSIGLYSNGSSSNSGSYSGGVSASSSSTITVASGATLTHNQDSTISGTLNLQPSSTFIVQSGTTYFVQTVEAQGNTIVQSSIVFTDDTKTYVQQQGSLTLAEGNVTVSRLAIGTVTATQNILRGIGRIDGNVTVYGTVAAGNSPGTIHVSGDCVLDNNSTFHLELASASSYDVLNCGGNVQYGGTLNISLLNSYNPAAHTSFSFINFAGTSGTGNFSKTITKMEYYKVNYEAHSAVLTIPKTNPSSTTSHTNAASTPAPFAFFALVALFAVLLAL